MDFQTLFRSYSRYFLVIFNLFFVITGIILLSLGASVKEYFNEFDAFLDNKYAIVSDLLIIIGVIIFLISLFGCCGALKENACLTTTFSTLLMIIFILEACVAIGGFLLKRRTEDLLVQTLNTTMSEYKQPHFDETTLLWDTVQNQFQCCGINNATDWKHVTNESLPLSCCHIPSGTVGNFTCSLDIPTSYYSEGCLERFGDFIRGHATSIESVGATLALLQLLGILFSCYLAKQIRRDYETV